MEENNKKLDFNFDFLGKDINPMEAQNNRIIKIIDKINEIKKIAKTVSSEQIDILIEDISIASENLSNNNLYDEIFISVINFTKELNKYKKYTKSIQLLKYVYNLPKSEENQKKCKEYIDNINKILSYKEIKITKIKDDKKIFFKKNEKDDFFPITIAISVFVILFLIVCVQNIHSKTEQKKIQIEQQQVQLLKDKTFQLYENLQDNQLSKTTKEQYQNEFNKNVQELANKSKQDKNSIKQEFNTKYLTKKEEIMQDLASAYVVNKVEFEDIKRKTLSKYFHNNELEMKKAVDNYLGYKLLQLKPQTLPRNGLLRNYTGRSVIATFRITNETPKHYYIKMYNSGNNRLAVTVFVRANSTTEFKVPLGSYVVKSAEGTSWYGFNDLFGNETSYETEEQVFDFYKDGNYVVGKEYQIQKTPYGNLNSREITANEF